MEKPKISKYVFKVTAKEYITPHYIRINLKSDEDIEFDQCTPGANNKIFIPPSGTREVQFSTFDPEKGEWVMPDDAIKPIVRTYTHRAIDPETKEITIDFVNHGDNGPASAWARNAVLDDQLGVAMKIRPTVHVGEADHYLLIADSTAIPVLCCILESLPEDASGRCIVEVATPEDKHPEVQHPGFEVTWLVNPHPEKGSALAETARAWTIDPDKKHFAYIAAEYSTVRDLRQYFKEELGWGAKDFYAFSYWKSGTAEDKSAQDRREERG